MFILLVYIELSEWTKWTTCSRTCGTGERTRERSCNGDSSSKDKNNPCKVNLFERETCNTQKCPVYTEWTSWTSCSTTCGGGNQERTRVCILPVRTIFSGKSSAEENDRFNVRESTLQCDGEPKEIRYWIFNIAIFVISNNTTYHRTQIDNNATLLIF